MRATVSLPTLLAVLLLLTGPDAVGQPAEPPAAGDLVGVWAAKRRFGPDLRGTLTVRQENERWFAEIAGHRAAGRTVDGTLRFDLGGGNAFRGRLAEDRSRIVGHWIQPVTVVAWNRFATPVRLERHRSGDWRGEVAPLDDTMTFYLVIRAEKDGTVGAFLRNPERNQGIRYRIDRVERQGDRVRFLGRRRRGDAEAGATLLEGRLDADTGRMSISFAYNGGTFDFERLADDAPGDLRPRAPSDRDHAYRQPRAGDDGWTTASVESVGMRREPIEALVRKVAETPVDSALAPYLHAVLVARSGKLVVEETFHGYHRDELHDTRSASKSLTSTLIGIAVHGGVLPGVDQPVYELLAPEPGSPALEPRKRAMTVEHLLTMTPGWDCDDGDEQSPGNEDVMQSQEAQPDWYRYALDLPMKRLPGEQAVYCSAATNLLGGVLGRAAGTWLPEFFETRFAAPMQIERYGMNLMPGGEAYMGGGIRWLPRDFLKLGQLMLDGGTWNGVRLLDEEWTRRATASLHDLNDQKYGYAWWIIDYPFRDRTVRAFYAGGNGGQMVIVIPELELSILFFAGNYGHFASLLKFRDDHVGDYILKAVVE